VLKLILAALAVVVLVLLVVVAWQPSAYRVTRTARITAPPAVLFAQVNDLRKFQAWNPWVKLDPAAKFAFEGSADGVGAVSAWSGNSNVGEGRMTITESRPNELVRIQLDFVKPFASTATAEFAFKPEGEQTAVTWSLTGQKNFVAKAIGLVVSMDSMIGSQFEAGLTTLKSLAETPARGATRSNSTYNRVGLVADGRALS